jgi:hypothetical protein
MNRASGKWVIGLLLVLAMLVVPASGVLAEDNSIDVVVSPNVLNLESFGGSVSLHTDFAYSRVGSVALTVNGAEVLPIFTFADDRGQLVVKCSMATVEAIVEMVEPGEATFDLTVTGTDGLTYSGTDTIKVISQAGVNRKK